MAEEYTEGKDILKLSADSVRDMYKQLDVEYPGLGSALEKDAMLAINGEMVNEPFLVKLEKNADVYAFPKMAAG